MDALLISYTNIVNNVFNRSNYTHGEMKLYHYL